MQPEVWLRGPIADIDPLLQPVSHALLQAGEDLERHVAGLNPSELWQRPGGAASVGFHLRHISGSLDRLLTYARGEALSETQRAALAAEGDSGNPPAEASSLIRQVQNSIEAALSQLRSTPRERLLDPRSVGRAALPSNVLGLLFHAAEHTQRHTGQVIATVKVVRGRGGVV